MTRRSALVTRGSRGIGKALAIEMDVSIAEDVNLVFNRHAEYFGGAYERETVEFHFTWEKSDSLADFLPKIESILILNCY